MVWILANWKGILAGTVVFFTVLITHEVDRGIYDEIFNKKVAAQIAADKAACASAQAITKEANDELQKNHNAIASKLDALKLQHPSACVSVGSGPKLSSGRTKHAGQNGISTDWLRDYAAECEVYRSEVTTCVNFLDHLGGQK